MRFSRASSARRGFSLLELSIVLGIIALLVSFGMTIGTDALKTADRVATQNRLAVIKQTLDNFAKTNGYLPCPADRALVPSDTNFGIEGRINDYNTTSLPICADYRFTTKGIVQAGANPGNAFIGGLPTRTLGLPDSYAGDAWGNKLTYAVSGPHVTLGDPDFNDRASYYSQDGKLIIMMGDRTGTNYRATTNPTTLTNGAAATYVVVSHGPDGRGAFPMNSISVPTNNVCIPNGALTSSPPCDTTANLSCNDIENCDDGTFAALPPTDPLVFYDTAYNDGSNPAQYFDDYIVWGTNALMHKVVNPTLYNACPAGSCAPWCAQCGKNYPIGIADADKYKLCKKVIDKSSVACAARCYWAGPDTTGAFVGCP